MPVAIEDEMTQEQFETLLKDGDELAMTDFEIAFMKDIHSEYNNDGMSLILGKGDLKKLRQIANGYGGYDD